ncbi:MAG: hypothetical protein K8L91_11855 [Anaerolineae bacterium]|nr:hypothetical protein [Anaerolineae bacterium]
MRTKSSVGLLFIMIVVVAILSTFTPFNRHIAQAKPSRAETAVTYVGTITGEEDVFVGVGLVGEEATIYICDGQNEQNSVSIAEWFIGPILRSQIEILNESNNRVQASLNGSAGEGTFTFADGSVKTFSVALVEGENAGLFRSEFSFGDSHFLGGWIILSDGSVRGAVLQRATADSPAVLTPASFIDFNTGGAPSDGNLTAIEALPLDTLPAKVSRGEGAEHGTLVMSLPDGSQISGQVVSGAAGQIGEVSRTGDDLIFTFTEITYDVAPMQLPGGLAIGPQTIKLDPSQPSTLTVNLTTGEISRNFHWVLTATDVLYNGQPSIVLGDTASAELAETTDLGGNIHTIRLLTHWSSTISLDTWTVGGVTLPSGQVVATAEFDGVYTLDFNK